MHMFDFDYSKLLLPELLAKAEQKTLIKRVKHRTSLQPCLDMLDNNINMGMCHDLKHCKIHECYLSFTSRMRNPI